MKITVKSSARMIFCSRFKAKDYTFRMSEREREELARIFSVHPDLVGHIPELLGDLWSLGVPPDLVVDLVRSLDLSPGSSSVLDLGCGKGAVAVSLALELGLKVTGIDIYQPFVDEARKMAKEKGVDRLCRFLREDVRGRAEKSAGFDVAIMVWVGDALGDLQAAAGTLRRQVAPGGNMVIADAYRLKNEVAVPHLENCPDRGTARRQLASWGDRILAETVIPHERTAVLYRDYINALRQGADRISRKHPELQERLRGHIISQEKMCEALSDSVVPVIWLLKKNEGARVRLNDLTT